MAQPYAFPGGLSRLKEAYPWCSHCVLYIDVFECRVHFTRIILVVPSLETVAIIRFPSRMCLMSHWDKEDTLEFVFTYVTLHIFLVCLVLYISMYICIQIL